MASRASPGQNVVYTMMTTSYFHSSVLLNFYQLMPTINGEVHYEIDANCTVLASALRKRGKER